MAGIVSDRQYSFGPRITPKCIKVLLALICIFSFAAVLLDQFLNGWTNFSIQALLSLSWDGILHYYLWQPITFLFIQPLSNGITFFFLMNLVLQCYFLWIIGTELVELYGAKAFLIFYFLSGLFCAICTLLIMSAWQKYTLMTGLYPTLFTLFVTWCMIYPDREILFFFIISLPVKIILAAILVGSILINVSQGDFVNLTLTFSGVIFAYLYGTIVWGLHSPYHFTLRLDEKFISLGERFRSRHEKKDPSANKIINLHTGEEDTKEDEFIDKMLDKISKNGPDSLHWWEKKRLDKISKTRKK